MTSSNILKKFPIIVENNKNYLKLFYPPPTKIKKKKKLHQLHICR